MDTLVSHKTQSVSFAANASGNLSYAWDFGDEYQLRLSPRFTFVHATENRCPYSSSYRRCAECGDLRLRKPVNIIN